MPPSKSTKKFEKSKLPDVLKARKANAKIKQKIHLTQKRKERKASDNAPAEAVNGQTGGRPPKKVQDVGDSSIGEMSMDQFFEGGFQLPEMKKKGTKPKTGKRKRTPVEENGADGGAAAAPGDESGSDSDSGDDVDAHKEQLAALSEKDPEFYKYLKENDAELLDFAEDADLAEIDALSASEDEEETPRKKKKAKKDAEESDDDDEGTSGTNEVTKALVEKWRSSMEKANSLRAMKEVVLAFRSAAHLNDDSGKAYKYTITDPDGMLACFAPLTSSNLRQSITSFS